MPAFAREDGERAAIPMVKNFFVVVVAVLAVYVAVSAYRAGPRNFIQGALATISGMTGVQMK